MTARLDQAEAEATAAHHFGVKGTAKELGGERTQNFQIADESGASFTLKISDPDEDIGLLSLENAALAHIDKRAAALAAPRVIAALDGERSARLQPGDPRHVRLFSYLAGTPLAHSAHRSPVQRRNLGVAVAALDVALQDFEHPLAAKRDLIWDVANIARVRAFLDLIDADRRPLAEAMLDRFENLAAPLIPSLPTQIVHSDINGQNILANAHKPDEIAGILDFGDLVQGPRVIDLAGAALLQMEAGQHDLTPVADVLSAYHGKARLTELEIDLLADVMIARCVINVTVTEELASKNPANRSYFMKNNPASWSRLERLASLSRSEVQDQFHQICKGPLS